MNKQNGSALQNRKDRRHDGMSCAGVCPGSLSLCCLIWRQAANSVHPQCTSWRAICLPDGVLRGVHSVFRSWWLVQSA